MRRDEANQTEPGKDADDLQFPIVIQLLKPLELKSSKDGSVLETYSECVIEREPEYGEIKRIQKGPAADQLSRFIEILTNIPAPLVDRIGARDIARIEAKLLVFFGK